MCQVHQISDSVEIWVGNVLTPEVFFKRNDTRVEVTLTSDIWSNLFEYADEIDAFFKGNSSRFSVWLFPTTSNLKLECFVSRNSHIVDIRKYSRGNHEKYNVMYATREGISFNQTTWEYVKKIKGLIDNELVEKTRAVESMRDAVLKNLTEILLELTKCCQNDACQNQIAHDIVCDMEESDWNDRVRKNLVKALKKIDYEKVIEIFRSNFGYNQPIDEPFLFNCIINDIDFLKTKLVYV